VASFLDAVRVTRRDPVKTFYYLCGAEVTLREQVLDLIRAKVSPKLEDCSVVSAETAGARVWDEVMAYSDTTKRRFVIVRDAEYLTVWEPFWTLVAAIKNKSAPVATTVFVSSAPDFDEAAPCRRRHDSAPVERKGRGRRTTKICPDCEAIKSKIIAMSGGLYVELPRPSPEAAVKVVAASFDDSWEGWAAPARPDHARALLAYDSGQERSIVPNALL